MDCARRGPRIAFFRPAPNVYGHTYTRRCKPLAAVCSALQRFAALCSALQRFAARPPRTALPARSGDAFLG
eukprot:15468653-Alexandrium_andersonii.AAC.1